MNHVLILGGSGFVGTHLCAQLMHQQVPLRVITRSADGLRDLRTLPNVKVIVGDPYSEPLLRRELAGARAAVNLVGILNEPGFGGAGFRRAHVDLTKTLIAALKSSGVPRYLHMSSLKAGQGRSHYLTSRGQAEALVKGSGLAWTIFQPSVIFGPGDGFFMRFAGLLDLAPVMPLAGASARFQPVYLGNVVDAFVAALERNDSVGKVYQLGGPKVYTLYELVSYTAQLLNLQRLIVPLPWPLGWLQGQVFNFIPGKPFSSDNFQSLAVDSVVDEDGLRALGIAATAVEDVVPRYLPTSVRQGLLDRLRRSVPRY